MSEAAFGGIGALVSAVVAFLTWYATTRHASESLTANEEQALMSAILADRQFATEELHRERESHQRERDSHSVTRRLLEECWSSRRRHEMPPEAEG